MAPSAERIASRFLQAAIGDPAEFLAEFGKVLDKDQIPEQQLTAARNVIEGLLDAMKKGDNPTFWPGLSEATDQASRAFFAVSRIRTKIAEPGHKLFLSILQTLTLPPALRKKVEMASRDYIKAPTTPRLKNRSYGPDRYREYLDLYDKAMGILRSHEAVAKEAIGKGKAHSAEGEGATKINVGGFTLINTGGFSSDVMKNVIEVTKKAETLLKSSGFGEICYGDVQVTNTIHKSNVEAFYLIGSDELFIRANVKPSVDTVHTVLHELGHRFEHKKLKSLRWAVERLYGLIGGQEMKRVRTDLKDKIPPVGEEVTEKGKTYRVTKTLPDIKGYKVHLQRVDDPRAVASISLDGYLNLKGGNRDVDADPDFKGYVTDYAKKSPGENFAEMFAFYCMGRLPVLQSVAFEELCFGNSVGLGQSVFTARKAFVRWLLSDLPG